MRWFGHIVRGDNESVGVENRRMEKEKQASEIMDLCGRGHEKEGSCATECRG